MTHPTATAIATRAIAYTRVSTTEQESSGLGLDAQRAAIAAELDRCGINEVEWVVEVASAGTIAKRPELGRVLDLLDAGEAGVLVVAKLDRLARSVLDFASVLERGKRNGWRVHCIDLGMDTGTAAGELTANVIAATAQYERRLISDRTKAALAEARRCGTHVGRPVTLPQAVVERIYAERAAGRSTPAIAKDLNRDGIPTAHGGARWWPATVAKVLATDYSSAWS